MGPLGASEREPRTGLLGTKAVEDTCRSALCSSRPDDAHMSDPEIIDHRS